MLLPAAFWCPRTEGKRFLAALLSPLPLLAVLLIFLSPLPVAAGEVAPVERNSLRIPGDIPLLVSETGLLDVPIYVEHGREYDALQVGLDYDELLLKFEGFSRHGEAIATEVYHLGDPFGGTIRALIEYDPRGAASGEQLLVWVQFRLRSLAAEIAGDYGHRRISHLDLRDNEVFFVPLGVDPFDVEIFGVPADRVLDGSLTIYLRDTVELGSARLSPDLQSFQVPVYVTHLKGESLFLTTGLDYDELYLTLQDVTPADSRVKEIEWHGKNPEGLAEVTVRFKRGIYPQLLRHHLLDLQFEFHPPRDRPTPGKLVLRPVDPANPEGEPGDAAAVALPLEIGGSGQGDELRSGHLYFVSRPFLRGDTDTSGVVTVTDALNLLKANFEGGVELMCQEAADVDDSGGVNLSDAIHILNFIFRAGPAPAAPFPEVGFDPVDSPDLGCEYYGVPYFQPLSIFGSGK